METLIPEAREIKLTCPKCGYDEIKTFAFFPGKGHEAKCTECGYEGYLPEFIKQSETIVTPWFQVKVREDGRITIKKGLRDHFGIKIGDTVLVKVGRREKDVKSPTCPMH